MRLAWPAIAVTAASMFAIALLEGWTDHRALLPFVHRLDPRFESTLHAWLGSILLGACALTLLLIAQRQPPDEPCHRDWRRLAAGLALLSVDEIVQLHETLAVVPRLAFGPASPANFWTLVGVAAVGVVAVILRRFLWSLPDHLRRRFQHAAAVYFGGAIGVEFLGGVYEAVVGSAGLPYVLLAAIEETLELVGAGLFLTALLDHLAELGVVSAPAATATAPRRSTGRARSA